MDQYELQDSLGLLDARKCNQSFGASLSLDIRALTKGNVVSLPAAAAGYLASKYKALLKPVEQKVKAVAKQSEIASAKQ